MTILQIAVLVVLAVVIGRLYRARQLAMLAASASVVFWLQPAEPFASLQYWLPFGTLAMVVLCWAITSVPEVSGWRRNGAAAAILLVVAAFGALRRYLPLDPVGAAGAPPAALSLAGMAAISLLTLGVLRSSRFQAVWQWAAILGIVVAFILLKATPLADSLVGLVGRVSGSAHPNEAIALSWLGFSYVAFRLMHTVRDRQAGRLPPVTLGEFANYVIFFPAFTAGPIDRIERFLKELCFPLPLGADDWMYAGQRLLIGLFKKFVIADLLAVVSINDALVGRSQSAGWLWLFLYAYAFRLYYDFSGYTDMAIGLGRLLGIRLPENFSSPYLKSNLTQFWNSWHMTLTQWFRAYVFNPVTRAMRGRWTSLPVWEIILLGQLITMVLIGLWHGIAWGFVAWGLWHGIGLFIHNRWAEFARNRVPPWAETRWGRRAMHSVGVFLTFNYVALGWLFFTLSGPATAWLAMRKLFGWA